MTSPATDARLARLTEDDGKAVAELIASDPVLGSLVHSFIVRRGLTGEQEFWGVWAGARLAGLATYDAAGRSTVLGCTSEHAPLLVDFYRQCARRPAGLAFVDAPAELATAIGEAMPPRATESLGVWAWDAAAAPSSSTPLPAGLLVRPVDPAADGDRLTSLYEADALFRSLGVDIPAALAAVTSGQRLMLVGQVAGRDDAGMPQIVTSAYAWLTDPRVSRVAGVVTHPAHRGKGYATSIMQALTRLILASGRRPYLYVDLDNTPAATVYARLGYRQYAVITKLRYGDQRY